MKSHIAALKEHCSHLSYFIMDKGQPVSQIECLSLICYELGVGTGEPVMSRQSKRRWMGKRQTENLSQFWAN